MLLVFFAAVNPAAVLLAIGPRLEGKPYRLAAACAGAGVAGVVIIAAAFGSEPTLDALDVEPETFRTSAGIVMAAVGVLAIWRARITYELEASWRSGIFPIGIPLLLGPAGLAAALSYADDTGIAETAVAGVVIVALTAAALAWLRRPRDLALSVIARFSGALLVVFAVAVVVSGVRDV